MIQKKTAKKEVYFIATKYKSEPAKVDFYTKKTGERVPYEDVEKKHTREGVKYFAAI